MRDLEKGEYSKSGVNSGNWCDTNSVSIRGCKASHRGG